MKLCKIATRGVAMVVLVSACAPVFGQLRVVQYNTGNQNDAGGYYTTIFSGIAAQAANGIARPADIITLQETTAALVGTSGNTGSSLIAALNRAAGTVDDYAVAVITDDDDDIDEGVVIYRKSTVDLIGGTAFTTTGPRPIARAQLRPKGYGASADVYAYSAHLKASTGFESGRASEVSAMRLNADNLGANKNVIYAGDFNFYTSSEPGYVNLKGTSTSTVVTAGNNNAAVDPVLTSGDWASSSAKALHTQAPTTTQKFPGQVTGGMDDRFDFALPSKSAADGEGLAIISGSYRAYGNNGTHTYNSNIGTGTGASAAVLTALENASDHIPVVSDYQVPARMTVVIPSLPVTGGVTSVLRGSSLTLNVGTTNSAAVTVAAGADELDYSITTSGSVFGAATGTVSALAGAQNKAITFGTAVVGPQVGSVTVTATSEQVPDAAVAQNFGYTVVDGSNASLNVIIDQDSQTQQLRSRVGTTDQRFLTIYNLPSGSGFTAELGVTALTKTSGSGYDFTFSPVIVAASTFKRIPYTIQNSSLGTLTASYTVSVGDAAHVLGGSASQSQLSTMITTDVVSWVDGAAGTSVGVPQLGGTWRPDAMPRYDVAMVGTTGVLSIAGSALCPDISPTLLVDLNLGAGSLSTVLEDWTLDGATHGYTVSTYPLDPTALLVAFSNTAFLTSGVTFSWNLTGTGSTVGSIVAIPEPGSVAAVMVVGAGLLSRRRR